MGCEKDLIEVLVQMGMITASSMGLTCDAHIFFDLHAVVLRSATLDLLLIIFCTHVVIVP